jgi:hypothetical protein
MNSLYHVRDLGRIPSASSVNNNPLGIPKGLLNACRVRTAKYKRWQIRVLQASVGHVTKQINHAVAIAPFIIVPADQLEEVAIQFD